MQLAASVVDCSLWSVAMQVWRAGSSVLMVRAPAAKATFVLRALQPADAAALQRLHDNIARSSGSEAGDTARRQDAQQPAAGEQRQQQNGSHFDQKTEKGSADLYFHYYGASAASASARVLGMPAAHPACCMCPPAALRPALLGCPAQLQQRTGPHLTPACAPLHPPPGCLMHQQNMLQDYIRTGTYFAAITENPADFEGKAVMDVGCGSGILSLFAAQVGGWAAGWCRDGRMQLCDLAACSCAVQLQGTPEAASASALRVARPTVPNRALLLLLPPNLQAGARVVYAVEASNMAHYARQLAAANPSIGERIKVLHGKVEEVEVPEKVGGLLHAVFT